MESRNWKMERSMGFVMKKEYITGEAKDIETIVRLRPWIEEESRHLYGNFSKTKLITDYDNGSGIFKFKIHFIQ